MIRLPFAALMAVLVASNLALAADELRTNAPVWILVTPAALRSAMEPLAQFRAIEGFQVVVLETDKIHNTKRADEDDATAIQRRIGELCDGGKTNACVLLAGAMPGSGGGANFIAPAFRGRH